MNKKLSFDLTDSTEAAALANLIWNLNSVGVPYEVLKDGAGQVQIEIGTGF
jgi:hypothetical protein